MTLVRQSRGMTFHPARSLDELFTTRTSIKWRRFPRTVLPMFVAEMDYDVDPVILRRVHDALDHSDTGYLEAPGALATRFEDFALKSWGWHLNPENVHLATDVTVGIVETLRLIVPPVGGRVLITSPVYPPFFEMVEEAHATVVDVPLRPEEEWSLDLDGIDAAFRNGVDAMVLCNPQNPTGRVHSHEALTRLAECAARWGVPVISDEVHAPLTHPGTTFTPFSSVAEEAGAFSITVTSASKAWNLAGLKCALVIAGDANSAALLQRLPEELAARTSILGLHANHEALHCLAWRDAALTQIVANVALLREELTTHAPAVRLTEPNAGYLAWLNFAETPLGSDPAQVLRERGQIALNSGPTFGPGGRDHARINLACDPTTVVEGVQRIARALSSAS